MVRTQSTQAIVVAIALIAGTVGFLPAQANADIDFDNGGNGYTNELTLADGELVSAGWRGSVKVEYTVTQLENSFRYEYTFYTACTPALSHAIIETSRDADVFNTKVEGIPTEFEDLKLYAEYDPSIPNTKSNPGLPTDLFGVKSPGADVVVTHISFESTHLPMWGSIYATGGNKRHLGYLYNKGLELGALPSNLLYAYEASLSDGTPLADRYVLVPENRWRLRCRGSVFG